MFGFFFGGGGGRGHIDGELVGNWIPNWNEYCKAEITLHRAS